MKTAYQAKIDADCLSSSKAFSEIVWPAICKPCGGGQLITLESLSVDIARIMDLHGGVDALQMTPQGVRGLATRVQWMSTGQRPWNSFTIRYKRCTGLETEFEKRLRAIENNSGYIYPALTIQSYLERGSNKLLSAGVVDTKLLYQYIQAGKSEEDYIIRTNGQDGNAFLVCYWDKLTRAGVEVQQVHRCYSV